MSRTIITGILALLGVVSPSWSLEAPGDLSSLLEEIRSEHQIPALAAGIVHEGKLVALGATGFRKWGEETRVTVEDSWHLGSCTKAMTASLIAILVQRDELEWTTRVDSVLEDLVEEIHPGYHAVTIEQLLSHRSGLPEDRKPTPETLALLSRQGSAAEQRDRMVRSALKLEPVAEPGEEHHYSNFGYVVAGAMAERVTGLSWEALMRKEIFEPLGMESAGFGPPAMSGALEQPLGHTGNPSRLTAILPGPWADNPAGLGPAGTVHCTIADWARFVTLHLGGAGSGAGRLLEPETIKALHASRGDDYALGWATTRRDWGGNVLSHGGSNGSWLAIVWVAPEKNFAVLVATNYAGEKASAACNAAVERLIRSSRLGGE